ncbi:MAG TPA: HsdR family type I site-specific deoxyribonuclease [Anaerolineae bacterium]
MIYQFIVFDNGVKKIARYQQYFAIKASLGRVVHLNAQRERTGGVIWHTTGSGKSITMVLLAKALALHPNIPHPRVVIVTDRIDLDEQIWRTFNACGKKTVKAESGADLVRLIRQGQADIITTVVNKFETVAKERIKIDDPDVFVLVDESHRSQYGTIQAKMRRVFKRACYIGFTGTPLLKKDKQTTVEKFGSFIHTYSMRRAVDDGAVVPLLYEGRLAPQEVDQAAIDKWFERVTRDLTPEQRRDLKRKFSRGEEVNRTEQRLRVIAYDISEHFRQNVQQTGFKAQLAAPSKRVALKYKELLDEAGQVSSAVIISAPDTREGNDEVDAGQDPELEAFWKRMMARYKSEEAYNREIKADFKRPDGVEILIVVDKLLTGFDEPRNTVLYIDKPLKEHSLLQAIARVNRLFEGKPYGLIIDYRGVLGELNEAMATYSALEAYDPDDVKDAFTDVGAEVARLPQTQADLWAVFKTVPNRRDLEALQRFLAPEDRRQEFYEALTAFAGCLKVALGSVAFHEDTPPAQLQRYKADLLFFHNLRQAVKQRYAETIDYKEYEAKIRKLMDSHIEAGDPQPLTEQVNIFEADQFDAEVARVLGAAAQADTIAHRVKQTATEYMDQDPAFYKTFSRLIDEAIEAYRVGRLTEIEYLKQVNQAMQQMRAGHVADRPEKLNRYKHAPAYFGVIREPVGQYAVDKPALDMAELMADLAIRIEEIIEAQKVRDWTRNSDVQKRIRAAIEDHLFSIKGRYDIPLTFADIEQLSESLVEIAKQRDQQ